MEAKDIAEYLNKALIGKSIQVNGHGSLSNCKPGDLVFINKVNATTCSLLKECKGVLAIIPTESGLNEVIKIPHILSDNPRLDFMRIVGAFFLGKDIPEGIHPTAIIESGAIIGQNVSIGAHCYIGSKVKIGDNTVILPNCSIYGKVTIGCGCYIKPGVVIGGPGFGFENDENGVPVHFPHTGEVIIGNNVYIGANTSIDRATIDATIIEDNVKIDNLVLVGHNSHVKKNTIIAGGAVLCGGSNIGESVWLSPHTSILQHLKVGSNAMVGIGAVVVEDVKEGNSVFGNPARFIGKNK